MGGGAARSEAAEAPDAVYLVGRLSFTVVDSSAILTVFVALPYIVDGELKEGKKLVAVEASPVKLYGAPLGSSPSRAT